MKLKKLKNVITRKKYILEYKNEHMYLKSYANIVLMELTYNINEAKKFRKLNDIMHYRKKYKLNEYNIISIV